MSETVKPSQNKSSAPVFLLLVFLIFSTVTRGVLFVREFANFDHTVLLFAKIFIVGLLNDCATFSYAILPVAACFTVMPGRIFNSRTLRHLSYAGFFIVIYILLFSSVSEYFFFDEFGSRFNFIAVDYLAYSREVIGNIRESYPLNRILAAVLVFSVLIVILLRRQMNRSLQFYRSHSRRALAFLAAVGFASVSFLLYDSASVTISRNRYANEIAKNGIYEFFSAFRHNELDYDSFYLTKDEKSVFTKLKNLLKEDNTSYLRGNELLDISRIVRHSGSEKKLNVIIVVVESLSSFYLGVSGNQKNLTPNLDRMAGQSLFFTNLYATGTRTVRGLEAIALSIPPMPGTSVIKRLGNENLFSAATVTARKGYDNKFIYGGFGYFDNMSYFFSNNGFETIDRNNFDRSEISFANIWGVCDEDLFARVLKESDESAAAKKPFFSIVMTTSNHRPYTYPEGRIDIPSHTGREGAVKYTDYAIGKFLEKAGKKSWFRDTLFVVVADHCASSAGSTDLPVLSYHIPLLIYSPQHVRPGTIDVLASQIDVVPTLFGMMNFTYETRFFGKDILLMDKQEERAFISSFQKLGYLKGGRLTTLDPKKFAEFHLFNKMTGVVSDATYDEENLSEAICYYQGISALHSRGLDKVKSFPGGGR